VLVVTVGWVAGGWVVGLLSYVLLLRVLQSVGWADLAPGLVRDVLAAWVVAIGVVIALLVGVTDRRARRSVTSRHSLHRGLVSAGAIHLAVSLWWAHVDVRVEVVGAAALIKDVLYHAPGLVLLLVASSLQPVPGAPQGPPQSP
jgi:hypothetical protein